MSKRETPMVLWYWEQVGGTLCLEYRAVPRGPDHAQRLIDAVIIPDGPKEQVHWRDLVVRNKDIICVQAKNHRLGMYLMGQTLFSAKLMDQLEPRSIRSVALCAKDDAVLRPMLEQIPGMEVVVAETFALG